MFAAWSASFPGYENGTLTLSAVEPGGLRAAADAYVSDYREVTKLVLTDESALNAADEDFIRNELTALTELDLSGHRKEFSVLFQDCTSLTAVKLPALPMLPDAMFSGCTRLSAILFTGNDAPLIGDRLLDGVNATAYVPDPAAGGYEQAWFTEHFSKVRAIREPDFSVQPESQSAAVGQDIVFSVSAIGAPAPALQWQRSVDGGATWEDIAGQTKDALRLRAVSNAIHENQFRCVAEGMAGIAVSDTATLTVGAITDAQTPEISGQPKGAEVEQYGSVTLSVVAEVSDGGTLSYQWYSDAPIDGATAASYSPPTADLGTVYYYVMITNTNDGVIGANSATVTSDAAKVTVSAPALVDAQTPEIGGQPNGGTVTVNESFTLTVMAEVTDGGTLTYQWYSNGSESNSGGTLLSGATAASYAPSTANIGTVYYYVTITNTNDSASGAKTATIASKAAKLIVNPAALIDAQTPKITGHPNGGTVHLNAGITLSVAAEVTDGGTLTYQWYSNSKDGNSGGTAISGATKASYTPSTAREGTSYYYIIVTNTNNNATGHKTASIASNTAKVTVNALVNAETPEIIVQPKGGKVELGDELTLSVTADVDDKGTLSYQWYESETDSNTKGRKIGGATKAKYDPPTNAAGLTYYYVEVTNTNGNVSGEKSATVASKAVAVEVYTTPGAPRNLAVVLGAYAVTIRWEPPEDDGGSEILGYQVSMGDAWVEPGGEGEHTFTELSSGTEYTFRMRAVNAAGHGEESALTATTLAEAAHVTGVNLDPMHLRLFVGESAALTVIVSSTGGTDVSVTWASGDVTVATVDMSGVVTAQAAGVTVISVTTNDGDYSESCVVTVETPEKPAGNGSLFVWIGAGAIALPGLAVGIYSWRKNRK